MAWDEIGSPGGRPFHEWLEEQWRLAEAEAAEGEQSAKGDTPAID